MEQSTLQEILDVEREIREQLDVERQQASQWLESTRRELEQAHLAELETIRREAARAEEAARTASAAESAQAIARLTQRVERAQGCSDEELRRRVRDCLAALMPESPSAR